MRPQPRHTAGFTIIEMVTVIVVLGIVAVGMSDFISRPILAYNDANRRAQLVDAADQALRRMSRDVRRSLPNSVRTTTNGTRVALEVINVADAVRYRLNPGPGYSNAAFWYDPTLGDLSFDFMPHMDDAGFVALQVPFGYRFAMYPTDTGELYTDAAAGNYGPGVITPVVDAVGPPLYLAQIWDDNAADGEQRLLQIPQYTFEYQSPQQRLFVVDTAISYVCDTSAETLTRITSYTIAAAQPDNPAAAPLSAGSSALVTNKISACSFDYSAGTPTRAGVVTLEVTLADSGEQISLLQQVHIENVP